MFTVYGIPSLKFVCSEVMTHFLSEHCGPVTMNFRFHSIISENMVLMVTKFVWSSIHQLWCISWHGFYGTLLTSTFDLLNSTQYHEFLLQIANKLNFLYVTSFLTYKPRWHIH